MKEHVRKKFIVALLLLAAPPLIYLTYAATQRRAERPRRAADAAARTIMVRAGGDLQAALDGARPGDVLVLEAGATFAGNFVLPAHRGAAEFVTVRSSRLGELAEGRRVTPADAPRMARLATPNAGPALAAPPGSGYFKFQGVEFTQAPGAFEYGYSIVELGDADAGNRRQTAPESAPRHFEFDRVIVRARDERTAAQRGVALNSAHTAIRHSHISGIKWEGVETQAVAGWNGPGPFHIENNYLEAAGINILFGGAVPTIQGLIPSDIVVRGNHLFKPLSWKADHPTYAGRAWTIKNLLELKSARRVLIEGNVLEHSWAMAQLGWAVIFNTANDSGAWSRIEDVEFRDNLIRGAGNGINLRARDESSGVKMARVRLANNLLTDLGPRWGGYGTAFQLLRGPSDVTIEHNTADPPYALLLFDGQEGEPGTGLRFVNNLARHGEYGVFGSGGTMGAAALERYGRNWTFAGNVVAGADSSRYPPGNLYPPASAAELFADPASGDYRLKHPRLKGRATDGRDPGCDTAALAAALAWYLKPPGGAR